MPLNSSLVIVLFSVLVCCSPSEAWYKQFSGPSYYTVGRASGLLTGFQRSSYIRRSEPESPDSDQSATNNVISHFSPQNFILKTMPICIKEISPNLQNCELFQDVKGLFKCKADVFLSFDSLDCAND